MGNVTGAFCAATNDLAEMFGKYGITIRFYYLFNESLVQRARNYIVDEFIRSDYTHFLFIDADIGFNAKDVLTLFYLSITNPDKYDILTAPYTKKTILWDRVKEAVTSEIELKSTSDLSYFAGDFAINFKNGTSEFRLDEPAEVEESGTGFMLIPREIFQKYKEAYPEKQYKPDHIRSKNFNGDTEIMAYFDCVIDPETKRYLSEDYYFCKNAKKIGIKLHMCPWIHLNHIGTYIYKGSLAALAQLQSTNQNIQITNQRTLTNKQNRNKILKSKGRR